VDETSFTIFPFGEQIASSADDWIEWLAETGGPACKAFWVLIDWDCSREELLEVLLSMYLLPASRSRTLASVKELHMALVQAGRALEALRHAPAVRLRLLPAPSPALGLGLVGLRRKVAAYETRIQSVDKLEESGETLVRAQLTALVRVSTGRWHDGEIGSIVTELLGRKGSAGAQEQWRLRHRSIVGNFVARYERQRGASLQATARDSD
jgi:hypothetical protein